MYKRQGENSAVSDYTYRNDVFSVFPYQKITRKLRFCLLYTSSYIRGSLESCGDEAEKETCKELLEELMEYENKLV